MPPAPEPFPSQVGSAGAGAAPTMAPLWLGAIAAGIQAMEIQKLLCGEAASSVLGFERYYDFATHHAVTSRLTRNPACRFDHTGGGGEPLADVRIDDLFAAVPGATSVCALHRRFVRPAACRACGAGAVSCWRFASGLDGYAENCAGCGGALTATAIDLSDGVSSRDLATGIAGRRLSEIGLRAGDLIIVETPRGRRLFERRADFDLLPMPPTVPGSVSVVGDYRMQSDDPRTVVIVGLGNIGSSLVPDLVQAQSTRLARGPKGSIDRLILIDPDYYDESNRAGQRIDASDVGGPKAIVQARRALALRPFLSVVAYVARAEEVPPGVFARAIVAGCVDSRAARMAIAETAWRVGSPFVDAAVDSSVPAVRIAGYMPGPTSADIECGFSDEDYAALEQSMPCITRNERRNTDGYSH